MQSPDYARLYSGAGAGIGAARGDKHVGGGGEGGRGRGGVGVIGKAVFRNSNRPALFRGLYQGIGSVVLATVPSCDIHPPYYLPLPPPPSFLLSALCFLSRGFIISKQENKN